MKRLVPFLFAAGLVALVLGGIVTTGCKQSSKPTPISTLLNDPGQFNNQVVRIAGRVTKSIGVLGYGGYRVDDGTGEITVVTKSGGAPREGADVGVEGEFRSAFTLGTETVAAIVEQRRVLAKVEH